VDPMVQATHMNVMASKVAELEAENATLKRKVREDGLLVVVGLD
jgi:hypothetical protein